MAEQAKILWHMDDESIKWQYCAICGQQRQRIIRQAGRPDFAFCDSCQSAFVLEDGGQMRMLYGAIPENMPQTRQFALKQWHKYFDIRAQAERERTGKDPAEAQLPAELKSTAADAVHGAYANAEDAILALEAQKSDIFYSRVKKLEPPPRILRETGELPDLDQLFKGRE